MFLANLAGTVIEGSKDGYPELEEKKDFIFNVLRQEEGKFNKTIDQGLPPKSFIVFSTRNSPSPVEITPISPSCPPMVA